MRYSILQWVQCKHCQANCFRQLEWGEGTVLLCCCVCSCPAPGAALRAVRLWERAGTCAAAAAAGPVGSIILSACTRRKRSPCRRGSVVVGAVCALGWCTRLLCAGNSGICAVDLELVGGLGHDAFLVAPALSRAGSCPHGVAARLEFSDVTGVCTERAGVSYLIEEETRALMCARGVFVFTS